MGGGAWPFLVGGAICLVNSVNEQDFNLLNRKIIDEIILVLLFLNRFYIHNIRKFKVITGL